MMSPKKIFKLANALLCRVAKHFYISFNRVKWKTGPTYVWFVFI